MVSLSQQARPSTVEQTPASFRPIADFVLRRPADTFPVRARTRMAYHLIDTLGVAIAATRLPAGGIARDVAATLYGSGPQGAGARMLFDGRRVSAAGAAFAGATQIDNLDGHDGYNPTKGHIGVAVFPSLAALAEARPELDGQEALAAAIVGYEIAGRAGIALHATVSDYHTSGAWNALGVAAMAARLRKMDDGALRQALGIAEYHGPRSQMMREIENPTMLHDGSGWGALTGISAAILAESGFTGAPAVTLEASEVAECWDDLGDFWQVERQYIKPYPVCRWAHPAIDAIAELREVHGVSPAEITGIHVNTFAEAARLFPGMPATSSRAQYSLPFAAAVMAVYGEIGVEHVSGAGLKDPAIAAMVDRVSVSEDERHSARFPDGRWSDVAISLSDGTVLKSGDVQARGGPEAPLGDEEIVAKFMRYSVPVVGEERAAAIVEAALSLQRPGVRFSVLADLLYEAP